MTALSVADVTRREIQVRGWREERVISAFDTSGRPVAVVTGLTVNQHGKTVAAMAIGQGPTVVLDGDASQIRTNIVSTLADLEDARRTAER
jgi:hypothetical protein